MNDIHKKINAIQDMFDELHRDVAKLMGTTAEPKKWSPVGGGWWIDGRGEVEEADTSFGSQEFGVERPTEQQAERAAIEVRKFNRLLALRDELCGDDVVDWSDGAFKHYLAYCNSRKKWDVGTTVITQYCAPFFTTEEHAKRACDMLNSGEVEL